MEKQPSVPETVLRELAEAGSIGPVCIKGHPSGFSITVQIGDAEKVLASARNDIRLFASLNTAVGFLQKLGVSKFAVDATDYVPGRLRNPRPDRAEALRKTRTRPAQETLFSEDVAHESTK